METNLKGFRGATSTSFIGATLGESSRKQLELDAFDHTEEKCTFIIPADTTSLNPSFLLGFLLPSYKKLGPNRFNEKYGFKIENEDPEVIKAILKNIEDGIRNMQNTAQAERRSFFFK